MIPSARSRCYGISLQYYSGYGHRDFILCLGYKASVIKEYFLNYKQTAYSDCIISDFGKKVEISVDAARLARFSCNTGNGAISGSG